MKRRSLLKTSALAAAALGTAPLHSKAAASARPNVIVILTDGQGYGDLSLHGNPVLKTPHMDRLGRESVRFTDFHAAPASTPSRSQLLTGIDCLRNLACAETAGRTLIRRDLPTVAEIFRQDGYITGLFGKWHLGYTYPDRPMDRGFDKAIWFRGSDMQSALEFDNDNVNPRYLDGMETWRAEGYCSDLWFNEAMSWMDAQLEKGQPFFTFVSSNTPQQPLWPPATTANLYKGKANDASAAFFAMIANLDDNIGRLEQWLQDSGARDNTIVVFLGATGSAGGRSVFNASLRDGSGSHYEGGHRVPCFLRWPGGNFAAGLEVATPTQAQDILPTLLELCEVPPGANSFDGVSLVPLLIGGDIADRMFVVQYGLRQRPVKFTAAVIWQQWRLQEGTQLYDIAADRSQQRDLARDNPDIVGKMREFYNAWWEALEPDFAKAQPMFIGAGVEKPELLSSIDWWEVDVDSSAAVSNGAGGARGGVWYLQAISAGEYEVELRRWPFHTRMALGSEGPGQTINGRALTQPVKSMPIKFAMLVLNGAEQERPTSPEEPGIRFRIRLSRGRSQLQGWFRDGNGRDLCGAYYARVSKLN